MSSNGNRFPRKSIKTLIFTKFPLIADCLKLLIENKSEIKVVDYATNSDDFLNKISQQQIDVVLLHFVEGEFDPTGIMTPLLAKSPATKLLVISDLTTSLDQTKLLKSGASGIVGTHQREEVLIRAIRQVSEGGVWFSQAVMAQLLGNGVKLNGTANLSNGKLKYQDLTAREVEVVASIALGLNNNQISKRLCISEATVRHHLSSIYSKLYISDRLNLVIYAYQYQRAACASH